MVTKRYRWRQSMVDKRLSLSLSIDSLPGLTLSLFPRLFVGSLKGTIRVQSLKIVSCCFWVSILLFCREKWRVFSVTGFYFLNKQDNVFFRELLNQHLIMEAGRRASSGETHNRPTKSVGSEKSIEKSPLHHLARNGRGIRAPSPAWEGKGEGSHGTPGRPQTRPSASGDESPDTSAAVPKFGDWDENNPASADGYTHIFNKVREERQRVPGMQAESSHDYHRRQSANNDSTKSCCFPWGRK